MITRQLCGYSTLNENGVKLVDSNCRWCDEINYEACVIYTGQKHFLLNKLFKEVNDAFEECARRRPGRK